MRCPNLVALALVASCGASDKPPPRAPAPAPAVARATVPAPAVAPPAAPAPDAASPAVAPAPPPAPHVAVLIPGAYDAMLFQDEAARLDAAARDKLAAQQVAPIELVPEPEIAALRAQVAAGRVRDGGPKCRRPPTLERAVRLHYPDAWVAQAETACMGGDCTLWLYVREPDEPRDWDRAREWPSRAEASVNVHAVTDVAAFEAAMRDLQFAAPEAADGGALGGIMGGTGRGFGFGTAGPLHRHLVIDVESAGPWTHAPAPADFAAEQRRLDACPASDDILDELLVDVDARGKIDRCETRASKCLCDAIRRHAFPAGAPLRRAFVRVARSGRGAFGTGKLGLGKGKRPFFVLLRGYGSEFVDDEAEMRAHEKALAACFAPTASPQRFDGSVVMTVDEAGTVQDARVAEGHDAMTAREVTCVTKWARTLAFSCESLGGEPARVSALFTVSR